MKNLIFALALVVLLSGCNNKKSVNAPEGELPTDASLGIESVPASLGSDYTSVFDRYTKVVAPNGKPIHILAQTRISNDQLIRVRNILQHFLTDYPGSEYGSDKSAVANNMADNDAAVLLLNGSDDGNNEVELDGQWLFEEEIQVEGGSWYMNQDYENHRDAAFEEILHMVHDYGIGVDGPNAHSGAAMEFQAEIRAAQQNALENNIWGMGAQDWIDELTQENSLSQEYLASLIDVYYGLWGAWNGNGGMYGLYLAKVRDEIAGSDPMGSELLDNKFFHPWLTYNARISAELEGIFSLKLNPELGYTNQSQYLKDITLTGSNNNSVIVNNLDNDITGNEGVNSVIFTGNKAEYSITQSASEVIVTDSEPNRDGSNTLQNIEKIQFADELVEL